METSINKLMREVDVLSRDSAALWKKIEYLTGMSEDIDGQIEFKQFLIKKAEEKDTEFIDPDSIYRVVKVEGFSDEEDEVAK